MLRKQPNQKKVRSKESDREEYKESNLEEQQNFEEEDLYSL